MVTLNRAKIDLGIKLIIVEITNIARQKKRYISRNDFYDCASRRMTKTERCEKEKVIGTRIIQNVIRVSYRTYGNASHSAFREASAVSELESRQTQFLGQ